MHDPPPGALDDLLDDEPEGASPLVRTLRPVVVTILLAGVVLGAFALVSHLVSDTRTESGAIDVGDTGQLALEVVSADVRLVQGDVDRPSYEARVTSGLLDTDLAVTRRGDVVRVDSGCHALLNPGCGVEITVTVPAGLTIDVLAGSGDIEAGGLVGSAVTLRTGDGDVDVEGLEVQDLTVTTGAGDVEAGFVVQPFAVKVTTDAGDVDLALPDGDVGYAVDARTDSGDVESAFGPTDDTAARQVLVRTGAGDVEVDRG